MSSVSVHLFTVQRSDHSIPLSDQLSFIAGQQLADRNRVIAKQNMRLESVELIGDCWYLDFAKIRFDNGPGKASLQSPVTGFQIADDEGFGEETAAIYCPANNAMVVQYNHYGVRSGSIAEYLSQYNTQQFNNYDLAVKYDPDVEASLAQKQFFRKLNFTLNFGKITQEHKDAGLSLSDVISLENTFQAGSVEIRISMPRGGDGLSLDAVRGAIDWFQDVTQVDPKAASKIEFHAGNDRDAAVEVLDLVHPKLTHSYESRELVIGPDKRYTRESRFDILRRSLHSWARYL